MSDNSTQGRSGAAKPKTSGSSPRLFWVGMALVMIVAALVGFWPTYFSSLFLGREPAEFGSMSINPAIHLHAAVFLGWIVLLLAQTLLAANGRVDLHMAVGRWGFLLGIVVLAVGGLIMLLKYRLLVAGGEVTWTQAPTFVWGMPGWINLLQFAILLGLGFAYRTSPEIHKRFMVFTGLAIISAATDRMYFFLGSWMIVMPAVTASPVWAYDLYTQRRIHVATLVGTLIVVFTSIHFLIIL